MHFQPNRGLTRFCLLTILLAGTALAQQPMTVAKLTDFIKSSIQMKNADKDSVKKPCATVDPNGPSAARSASTWIH